MDENRYRQMVDRVLASGPDWVPPPVWSGGILLLAVGLALPQRRLAFERGEADATERGPRFASPPAPVPHEY